MMKAIIITTRWKKREAFKKYFCKWFQNKLQFPYKPPSSSSKDYFFLFSYKTFKKGFRFDWSSPNSFNVCRKYEN